MTFLLGILAAVRIGLSYADVQMILALFTISSLLMNLHISSKLSELKVYIHEKCVMKGTGKNG